MIPLEKQIAKSDFAATCSQKSFLEGDSIESLREKYKASADNPGLRHSQVEGEGPKNRTSGVGTPGEAIKNILTGRLISSMFTKVFSLVCSLNFRHLSKVQPYTVARKQLVIVETFGVIAISNSINR
jgi:hypothetical protein